MNRKTLRSTAMQIGFRSLAKFIAIRCCWMCAVGHERLMEKKP